MLDKIHSSIRGALLVFCLIFVGALTCVIGSYLYLDSLNQDEIRARQKTQVWKTKIDQAKINNNIIVEYEKPYLALIDNDIVGEENRLSWFETLQATSSAKGLDTFTYSTSRQTKVLASVLTGSYSSLNMYTSTMNLDMKLSHEGDLFTVFNELSNNAKGLYSINDCTIDKLKVSANTKGAAKSNMAARCQLSWFTMKPAKT